MRIRKPYSEMTNKEIVLQMLARGPFTAMELIEWYEYHELHCSCNSIIYEVLGELRRKGQVKAEVIEIETKRGKRIAKEYSLRGLE